MQNTRIDFFRTKKIPFTVFCDVGKMLFMGERNLVVNATIIGIEKSGEQNRSVLAFSRENGIFYATLYGGAKSKMRSLVQIFNSGKLYLYHDKVRNFYKISDFDVESFHLNLRNQNIYEH